jgi:hypothetical protein
MQDEGGHRAMVEAGKTWSQIKDDRVRHCSDWTMIIGPALMKARAEAMAIAGTNQAMGRGWERKPRRPG